MLKRMRRRFIMAAMTAITVVMLLIAAVINIWNYSAVTFRQDRVIEGIWNQGKAENRSAAGPIPFMNQRRPGGKPREKGPEAEFTTRFFILSCTSDGELKTVSMDYIASVSEEQAQEYGRLVLSKRKDMGYCGSYRYKVFDGEQDRTIIFLNAERELQSIKTLFLISCFTAVLSLAVVFILVLVLSRRAIDPYIKNMERQKLFITDAGHELKTPLTSIAASADVLAMEHGEDEWIDNIRRQTVRLTRLTENLVTLSRLDEEAPFPEKQKFSLSDAAWETAEPFVPLARAKGKIYSQEIEEGIMLNGDQTSVQQMISILLDNALRYSDENGQIYFKVYQNHRKACICVENTCELEDISDLERLFDRFYRPDSSRSRNTGGTGIGLSIAKAIAEAHGGTIKVKSSNGKRISFQVIL